jgi:hypothetical protein
MDGQFHVDASTAADHLHFADQIAQLLGEDSDLDPLFLEESWTLGVPAATEKWQQRQRTSVERERQNQSFRSLHNLGSIFFVDAADSADFIPQALASAVQKGYGADSLKPPAQPEASPTPNRPGAPSFAQHAKGGTQTAHNHPMNTPIEMTLHSARRLLGITETTTPAQLRSAYRRMVSQFHPDRLVHATSDARQRATDHMAAINEAYRLLRTLPKSA